MRLKLKILGEATAVGLIDIGGQEIGRNHGSNKSIQLKTLGRAAMFAGGVILNAMTDKASAYTEALYVASEPLLIRSIANLFGVIPDAPA